MQPVYQLDSEHTKMTEHKKKASLLMRFSSGALPALLYALLVCAIQIAVPRLAQAEQSSLSSSCEINPPVLKAWRKLRYSWYARLPEAALDQLLQFPLKAEIADELKRFYQTNAQAIQAYRHCLFEAYTAAPPALTAYQELPVKDFGDQLATVFPDYAQLYLSPFDLMSFMQSTLLSQHLSASEMAAFYQQLTLGQSLYSAQPLSQGQWRLWLDSYAYLIAVDFGPEPQQVSLHGFWKRQQP